MKTHHHIGVILDIVRGSPGLEPGQKDRLEKYVKALDHAVRTRNLRRVRDAVARIAQEVAGTID